MSNKTISKEEECVVEHILEAPVEIVWQMWTQPDHFKQWYGPNGASVPVAEMDVRIGGKHLFCMEMQTPNGKMHMWSTGEYTEIVPNERLVYTDSMADENGNVISPQSMGMPEGYPQTTTVTVLLEDLGGRTKMILTHSGVPASATGGWTQAFGKMADRIESVLNG